MIGNRIVSIANQLVGSLCRKASAYTSARWEYHLSGSTPKKRSLSWPPQHYYAL
jgi:hypothetical protein